MRLVLSRLDPRWIAAASSQLCGNLNKLFESEINQEIEHILAFNPFFPGDVDLSGFIAKRLGQTKVYFPRVNSKRRLDFYQVSDDWTSELSPGYLDIPEPKADPKLLYELENGANTLVIMPGLAFDHFGNRLSADFGLYDLFLRKTPLLQSIKVGVAWSLQLVKEIKSESHQVMVDWVCHERECLRTARDFDEDFE